MEGHKGEGLLQNMFSYNGYAAKCVKDVYNPDPSESPKTTVKIVSNVKNNRRQKQSRSHRERQTFRDRLFSSPRRARWDNLNNIARGGLKSLHL